MKTKLTLLVLGLAGAVLAKEGVVNKNVSSNVRSVAAGCASSTAKTELAFNNVRTVILINGDMWWDAMAGLGPQYEIPKGSGKNSLYAGALWMGGIDASNNLKVAAQTYRQGPSGAGGASDFWPGPLDTNQTSNINPQECLQYDRHWKVTFQEIVDHKLWVEGNPPPGYDESSVPEAIKTWPGTGYGLKAQYLAPYVDDGDGIYDYHHDYINHNLLYNPPPCGDYIFGDQCIFWIFNDNGNIHTETGGAAIGFEIHGQAFAFATSDEINNMTFYNYKIINRSSTAVNNNYFGVWVDPDLGFYNDDFVGCDVKRGLGYCYNGDADDEGANGYGLTPPAIGVDFFQGPLADDTDHVDNNRNCILDEDSEQIIMSRFVYYNNQYGATNGDPLTASDYYNYLQGIWRNNQPMTYGGNGAGQGNGATNIPCYFMYPGNTDHEWEYGTGGNCITGSPGAPQSDWSEVTAQNTPADRRFLHSAGPFTLKPGAVNFITTGAVWARATQGGPQASVDLLRVVDDKAQSLFDGCFAVPNGPDAPDITLRELDREVILTLSNNPSSNNYQETYQELDPDILLPGNDSLYRFQGYQVYQLKDATVSAVELHNADKARLVAQVDIKDDVTLIVNHYFDFATQTYNSVSEVNGENKGIRHSFRILKDYFATGDNHLINHKNYFYSVIAYGFNEPEVAADPYLTVADSQDGKRRPYLAGRRNIKVYTAIPHIAAPENFGQDLNSAYGNGPKIRRIEGTGNGYLINYHNPDATTGDASEIRLTLDLTAETVNEILDAGTGYRSKFPEYEPGRGPVNIKVIDPVKVPKGDFILWLENTNDAAHWYLKNIQDNNVITADVTYSTLYEQLFPEWGLSVTLSKISGPLLINDSGDEGHGFVEATMTFSDPNKRWLSGVADQDGGAPALDWISSPGNNSIDPNQHYEKVLGGIWSPFRLVAGASTNKPTAAANSIATATQNLGNLNSVDVVITRDKSKWSRCVVVEENYSPALAQGGAAKCMMRKGRSLDINGNYLPDTVSYYNPKPVSDTTWGTFMPGDTMMKKGNSAIFTIIGSIFIYNSDSSIIINDNTVGFSIGDTVANRQGDTAVISFATKGGMSWFPGYAIDVEKGERLNIMFGEDSWLASENGRDMKWNPTAGYFSVSGEPMLGGIHYIYIVNSNTSQNVNNQMVGYDGGEMIKKLLSSGLPGDFMKVYKNVSWVNFPLLADGYGFDNGMVPTCDVKIRLRVARPYSNYGTGAQVTSGNLMPNQTYVVYDGRITYNGTPYSAGQTFTTNGSIFTFTINAAPGTVLASNGNNGYPLYSFSTDGLANSKFNEEAAKNALDLINIVPNPYYAYSAYEGTLVAGVSVHPQLDNRVKIVNLPPRSTVSIYTVNGILVRRFNRDVAADNSYGTDVSGKNYETSLDWDLKNHKNIPIASGLYLVHVEAKNVSGDIIGERTLRWFGVLRPIDLDSF